MSQPKGSSLGSPNTVAYAPHSAPAAVQGNAHSKSRLPREELVQGLSAVEGKVSERKAFVSRPTRDGKSRSPLPSSLDRTLALFTSKGGYHKTTPGIPRKNCGWYNCPGQGSA